MAGNKSLKRGREEANPTVQETSKNGEGGTNRPPKKACTVFVRSLPGTATVCLHVSITIRDDFFHGKKIYVNLLRLSFVDPHCSPEETSLTSHYRPRPSPISSVSTTRSSTAPSLLTPLPRHQRDMVSLRSQTQRMPSTPSESCKAIRWKGVVYDWIWPSPGIGRGFPYRPMLPRSSRKSRANLPSSS